MTSFSTLVANRITPIFSRGVATIELKTRQVEVFPVLGQ